MMRFLLLAAALGEGAFGVFIFAAPALALNLLFASEPSSGAIIMTRVAGIALIGLGVACYPREPQPQALYGMLAYSVFVMLYLITVGIKGASGILLWPAVVVHALLSVSLIVAARSRVTQRT